MKKLFFTFFICIITCAAAFTKPPVMPPANTHPRLMFRESDLPSIKERMQNPENAGAVNQLNSLLSKYGKEWTESGKGFYPQKNKKFIFNGDILAAIEGKAFQFALTKNVSFAQTAYSGFIQCCKTMDLNSIYDDYRPLGQMMLTAAEIYDWCYEALDKKQKSKLISLALSYAQKLQIGYPPVKQGAITGHGCENQLLRALLACGIAFYDEKPSVWELTAERFYSEYVPVRKYVYTSGEPNFQGSDYGPYRSIFDLWSSLLITSMGEADPYDGLINNWANYYVYLRRPDGLQWRLGDCHAIERDYDDTARIGANAFLCSVITGNPYTKCLASLHTKNFSYFKFNQNGENDELITPVQFLIFNRPEIIPKDFSELKTVYYAPYPMGEYYAFSAWNDKNAAAVHAKIGAQYSANHEHRDAGSFEIFCKRILAGISGYYLSGDGSNGYSNQMTQQYFHGAASGNVLLMEPQNPTVSDYGDQISLPDPNISLNEWQNSTKYQRAKILKYSEDLKDGKGIVYLSGDISGAYSSAKDVKRSMLSIFTGNKEKPLIFIVYDDVNCDTDRSPVFQLHVMQEPEISEDGKTQLIKNEGILKNTTLLPESASVKVTGGEGKRWTIAGKNLGNEREPRLKKGNETGWGKIEIRSPERKNKMQFLNVMQAAPEETELEDPVFTQEGKLITISVQGITVKIKPDFEEVPEVEF